VRLSYFYLLCREFNQFTGNRDFIFRLSSEANRISGSSISKCNPSRFDPAISPSPTCFQMGRSVPSSSSFYPDLVAWTMTLTLLAFMETTT
jgi:hypothetical protein